MNILVINAGSSSVKFGLFDTDSGVQIFKGQFCSFSETGCTLELGSDDDSVAKQEGSNPAKNITQAIAMLPELLEKYGHKSIDAVGHRVAHGGEKFQEPALITDEVYKQVEQCIPLAPLHNPPNLEGITVAKSAWPKVPHVAVFDTAFHQTMRARAYNYAVPKKWREKGLRRYGFHGTSHKYVAMRAAKELGRSMADLRIVSCHLGSGASVCAVDRGYSSDTTMGMTPLEGLVMGTRSGDIDPGAFMFLQRELGLSLEQIESELYKNSGLKGFTGSNDMCEVEQRASQGDGDAQVAIDTFAYRVRKYIGAYAATMGGLDAVVFTGGIGENSVSMRRRICDRLEFLGLHLDDYKNQNVSLEDYSAPQIQADYSRVKVMVTQTREQWMIAQETKQLLDELKPQNQLQESISLCRQHNAIPVSISVRHVHLDEQTVEKLFGEGYELTPIRELYQPGNWAAEECVDVIGPKGEFTKVRVLGPLRSRNQIEVSRTGTYVLGVDAPIRASGDLKDTPSITLRGPAGEVETDGLIIARRHIHMSPLDAERFGVEDKDFVDVEMGDGMVLKNVLIRVHPEFRTEMHVDTDEGNAAKIKAGDVGYIVLPESESATIKHSQKNNIIELPKRKQA